MQNNYLINQTDTTAEILLYGGIGNWQSTDSKRFVTDFKKLEASHDKINVRINSTGGDCFEGLTIFSCIKNSSAEVHTYIDGVAASMASAIAMAGKKIFISKYGKLMIHRVTGSVNGDADKLRETASLMEDLEKSLLDIYAIRTGKDITTIQNTWMQPGKDTWFTANDAVNEKLVDEIFDNGIKKAPAKNKSVNELWQFFNTQFENKQQPTNMEILSEFISFYKLPDNATQQDILIAMQNQLNENVSLKSEVENLKTENANFKSLLETETKNKIQDLVNNAIKNKRITEKQRASYILLAEANYEATKSAIEGIAPYQSIASQLQLTNQNDNELSFIEYQQKNPQALMQMKKNDFERFALLYEKQYGVRPKSN